MCVVVTLFCLLCCTFLILYTYLQDQSELGVVLHLLVPNLDVLALLDGQPSQQGIQHWVHILSNVLEQQTVSICHCTLNCIKVAGGRGNSPMMMID